MIDPSVFLIIVSFARYKANWQAYQMISRLAFLSYISYLTIFTASVSLTSPNFLNLVQFLPCEMKLNESGCTRRTLPFTFLLQSTCSTCHSSHGLSSQTIHSSICSSSTAPWMIFLAMRSTSSCSMIVKKKTNCVQFQKWFRIAITLPPIFCHFRIHCSLVEAYE